MTTTRAREIEDANRCELFESDLKRKRDRSSDSVFIDKDSSDISYISSRVKERRPPNCLALAPPPIPKRVADEKRAKSQSKSCSSDDTKNDLPSNELCSMSFDDIGDSDDLVIFDKKSQLIDPNQSSSDSSRSQTTIDTGYVSAFESANNQRQFRGRFSSEDTQSSLDSYLSSDLKRADTIDSLQSNFTDSPFILKKNVNIFNFDQSRLSKKISSSCSIDSDNSKLSLTPIKSNGRGGRLPPVPARKTIRQRTPPAPPLRTSQLALHDISSSMKVKSNSNIAMKQNSENAISKRDENVNKPPPLSQIHHTKINQRQDSSISSDSYSMISSPGYNSKTMETPLLKNSSRMKKSKNFNYQSPVDSFNMTTMHNKSMHRGGNEMPSKQQDSGISSESISQTSSSSGFNTSSKLMDTPLLAHALKLQTYKPSFKQQTHEEIISESDVNNCSSTGAIIKSASTPASLQTIVRFSNGSNMSLHHKILRSARKNSNPNVKKCRFKFRFCQILFNALALLIITGGLAAYFNAYPTIQFVNKTDGALSHNLNPAPGVCLPVIVKFCINHKIPYNFTVFPNFIGHFGQVDAQHELETFDALVDVQCFELVPLFLCSLFVPKCGSNGKPVSPCKSLCVETMRRCGFFFDVFGLELPDYFTCKLFNDPPYGDCVGGKEMKELKTRKPVCNEFTCDKKRCVPFKYVCDGVVDCYDQTDELKCSPCNESSIHCGERKCMSDRHICDGQNTCPYGQDERNCIRLSSTNGDVGRGTVEIYKANKKQWEPACIKNLNLKADALPATICSKLGYSSVNSSRLVTRGTNYTYTPIQDAMAMRMAQRKTPSTNLLRDLNNCSKNERYGVVAELTCTNFECGKVRTNRKKVPKTRIIGGNEASPGDWPFLAAILGGPEEIFYCAGVLISDQFILTASHCIGNHTLRNLNDWTVQLGMTRRHSHAHYGQKIKVKRVIPHPQYNEVVPHDNDIALFQLATRVAFHDHLLPVCLPPSNIKDLAGLNCTVIGWGKREDKNSYEPAINEVVVPVLTRDTCSEWLESLNITDGMICAGYETGGYDACQLCPWPNDKERWFVGGIVSWGIMCANPRLPGVYANVPKYIPWIMSHINNHTNKYDGHGG